MAEPRTPHQGPDPGPQPFVPDPPQPPDLRALLTAFVNAEDPAQQAEAARAFFSDPGVYQRIADAEVTGLALRVAEHLPQGQMLAVGAELLQLPQGCEGILRSGDAEELRAALNISSQLTDHWNVAPIGHMAIGQLLVPDGCAMAAASTPSVIGTALLAAGQLPEAADGADDTTPLARDARAQLLTPQACDTMARSAPWPDFARALEAAGELPDGPRQRAIGHLLPEHRCRSLQGTATPETEALLARSLGHLSPAQQAPLATWLGRPAVPLHYRDVPTSVPAGAGARQGATAPQPGGGGASL